MNPYRCMYRSIYIYIHIFIYIYIDTYIYIYTYVCLRVDIYSYIPVTLPVSMEFPEGPSVSSSVDPIELQGVRRDKVYLPDKVYLTRIGSSTDVHMNSHVFCHVVFLREHARYTINGSMYGCFFLFC